MGGFEPELGAVEVAAGVAMLVDSFVFDVGAVGVGELLPAVGDDPIVGVLERLGSIEQQILRKRRPGRRAWVGGEPGELADLGDPNPTGGELAGDVGEVTQQCR